MDTFRYLCVCFFVCLDRVLLCSPGWCQNHYVAETGLEFSILLPQAAESWDYKCEPACLSMQAFRIFSLSLVLLRLHEKAFFNLLLWTLSGPYIYDTGGLQSLSLGDCLCLMPSTISPHFIIF
jgi:hypothetical protein